VRIPGHASVEILETRAPSLSNHLALIPLDRGLWEVGESVVADGSAAAQLWAELRDIPSIEWVTAGKLLARKRPRLIPVYDRVVRQVLGRSDTDNWWIPLRELLVIHPELVRRWEALKRQAVVPHQVSLLRILDVALWMSGGASGGEGSVEEPVT